MRFKFRRLNGVNYYPGMMRLLQALVDAGARYEMYHVGAVPPRTRAALEQRDWAVFSDEYALITARGVKALNTYYTPHRERGGDLCYRCGCRPRMPGFSYCRQCQAGYNKSTYRMRKANGISPRNMTCPRCGQRQRHIYTSGRVAVYCVECGRAYTAEKNARLLARLEAGELSGCVRCGQPRYVNNGHVYSYCRSCFNEVQRAYRKRLAFKRVLHSGDKD